MSSAIVPKYRDELSKEGLVHRRPAKALVVGDVLYPRAGVVQAVERFEGVVGEGEIAAGQFGVPDEAKPGDKVPMVRVIVRYKETGAGQTFIQEVGETFEYLLWNKRSW